MQCSDCLTLRHPPAHASGIAGLNPAEMLERASRRVFRLKDSACLFPLFTIERQQVEERHETIENNAAARQTIYTQEEISLPIKPSTWVLFQHELSRTNRITNI